MSDSRKLSIFKLLSLFLVLALVAVGSVPVVEWIVQNQGAQQGAQGSKLLVTIGSEADASGTADFVCDGVNDNVQFQLALNNLDATGGKILVVSSGTFNFGAGVTRAISNVTIEGTGYGTYITGVASITAGGNNWKIVNLRFDAGGMAMGATTGWIWENVDNGGTLYTLRNPSYSLIGGAEIVGTSITDSGLTAARPVYAGVAGLLSTDAGLLYNDATDTLTAGQLVSSVAIGTAPLTVTSTTKVANLNADTIDGYQSGRSSTFTVAASNASAGWLAQADYITDGVADEVQIQAAIDALPASGGRIHLSTGTFNIAAPIEMNDHGIWIDGESNGWSSSNGEEGTVTTKINVDAAIDAFWLGNNVVNVRGLKISNLTISGSAYNNNKAAIYSPYFAATKIDSPVIESMSINNYHYGVYLRADTAYVGKSQILFVTNGVDFSLGGDLTSVNQVMAGDIFGIGFNGVSRVENSAVVNADDGPMGFTTATIGINGAEIANGNHIAAVQAGNSVAVGIKNSKIVTNNYFDKVTVGIQVTDSTNTKVIANNFIEDSVNLGIAIGTGAGTPTDISVTGNTVINGGDQGILVFGGLRITVQGNTTQGNAQYGIYAGGTSADIIISNNIMLANAVGQFGQDGSNTGLMIKNNKGYIAPGEHRTYTGSLTAGNANAFAIAWQNPEAQAVLATQFLVEVTTVGGTGGSLLDVGPAANGTTHSDTFIDGVDINALAVYDSRNDTDNGANGVNKPILVDANGGATDYITGQILVANAANLVGKFYIEVIGR
jgi:hypothetical protein